MDSGNKDCRKYALRYYSLITNVGGRICRSVMVHCLEKEHRKTLSDFLTVHKSRIREKSIEKILKKDQFEKLYPNGAAASDMEDFDITLLMFLFINFIFAEIQRGKIIPKYALMKPLNDIQECDTSVITDLARLRCYRNKLHDITDTKISMKEEDFWENVTKLTEIFIRLEKYYTKNGAIGKSINEEIHANLNIDGEIKDEVDIKMELQKIKNELEQCKQMETEIWKILQTDKERRFEDVKADLPETVFVKTKQYVKAKDTLRDQKIIVLNGSPGEGKTTVAKMLLKEISHDRCIGISSAKDMKFIGNDVDAVLIDDMFGAGTFDKEMFRPWQNNLNLISKWVQSGQGKYVVITSRTYIWNEAMQKLFTKSPFCKEMIIQLSSAELTQKEKLTILQNHFIDVDLNHFYNKNKRKKKQKKHDRLLKEISELKSNASTAAFTVGFPECARLFSRSKELYNKGISFFEAPMEEIKSNISELCKADEIYVAFFVLWAQEKQTIRSRDLEQPIDETSCDILTPIKILQYSPRIFLPKIRDAFKNHTHKGGLIKQNENEMFRFSHYVVRDAVGMITFERNQTAALALCDKHFIERYIALDEETCHSIKLKIKKSRYDQLSSRILSLVTPDSQIRVIDGEINKMLSEHYLLFRSSLFENEDFCLEFLRRDSKELLTLLTTPFRSCNFILEEHSRYKFIGNLNLDLGLLSFLIWHNKKATFFAQKCLEKMASNYMEKEIEQELSVALYISSALGWYDTAEFCIDRGCRINSKMILIAFENAKKARSSSGVGKGEENVFDLLKAKAKEQECFPDNDGYHPIHLAAIENDIEFVGENIRENPENANISLEYLSKDIIHTNKTDHEFYLKNASLYHIAVFEGNKQLIELLHVKNVPSTVVDSDGRSPFLYAIEIGKVKVIKPLYEIAKQKGNEMSPKATGDTPLHLAIIKSVTHRDKKSKVIIRNVALDICRESKGDLHHRNSDGVSPLHTACKYKQADIMQELLKTEKDFHMKEQNLLQNLIKEKNDYAIQELLNCGFDRNMKYDERKTLLDVAKESCNEKIICIFQELLQNKKET